MLLRLKDCFGRMSDHLCENPNVGHDHYVSLLDPMRSECLSPQQILFIRAKVALDGYVLITTDLDDFASRTPPAPNSPLEGPYFAEAALSLVGDIFGTIESISHQNDGWRFHDIVPVQADSKAQTSGSSEVKLELHTELAFVEDPPDYLMLFCVRADHGGVAETHLHDAALAIDTLSANEYEILTQKRFFFGLDANITEQFDRSSAAFSIFNGSTARLSRFDLDLHEPQHDAGDIAFASLARALIAVKTAVRLRQGQLLVVDNKRMVHSRSIFAARYDGTDRWLKRCLLRGK